MASGREYGAAIFSPGLAEVLLIKHEEDGTWSFPFTSTTESNVHVVATASAVKQLLGIDIGDKISRTHWIEAEFPQTGALVRLYVALGVRPETVTPRCITGASAQWHPLRSILPPVNAILRADHARAGAPGDGGRLQPEEDDEDEDDGGGLLLEPGIAPFLAKLKALLDRHPEWRMAQLDPHLTRLIQEAITLPPQQPQPQPQPPVQHQEPQPEQPPQQQQQQQEQQEHEQQQQAPHDQPQPQPQLQAEQGQEQSPPPPVSPSLQQQQQQPEQQPGAQEEGPGTAGTAARGGPAGGGTAEVSRIKEEPLDGAEVGPTGPVGPVSAMESSPQPQPPEQPLEQEQQPERQPETLPGEQQQQQPGEAAEGGQADMATDVAAAAATAEVDATEAAQPSGGAEGDGPDGEGQTAMDTAEEDAAAGAAAATGAEVEVERAEAAAGGDDTAGGADGGSGQQSGAGDEGSFWRGPRPQEHLLAYCRLRELPEPCYSLVVKKSARRPLVTASCLLPHLGLQITPDMHVPGGMHAACQAAALAAILWLEGALPPDGGELVRVVPVGWPPLLSEARGESWEAAQMARRAGARRELDSVQREALLREMDKKRQRLVAEAAELERLMAALRGGERVPEPDLTRLTASLGLGEGEGTGAGGEGAAKEEGVQGVDAGAAGGSGGGGKGAVNGDGGAGLAGSVTKELRALQFRSGPGSAAAGGGPGAGPSAGGRGAGGRAPGTKRPREDVHSGGGGGGVGPGESSPGGGGAGKNVVMELKELCDRRRWPQPLYCITTVAGGPGPGAGAAAAVVTMPAGTGIGEVSSGPQTNQKRAKEAAAAAALAQLSALGLK